MISIPRLPGLWLTGKRLWLKKRLTKLQAGFLCFSQNRGFHLWNWIWQRELRLQYLIHEDLRDDCIIKQKFSLLAKGLYWKSYGPLYLSQPMQQMAVELDRTFLTYIQQQLFYRHPKWLKLQEELYMQDTIWWNWGFQISLSHLWSGIRSQNLLQIKEDQEGYTTNNLRPIISRKESNPFRSFIPHVFMLNRKANFLR